MVILEQWNLLARSVTPLLHNFVSESITSKGSGDCRRIRTSLRNFHHNPGELGKKKRFDGRLHCRLKPWPHILTYSFFRRGPQSHLKLHIWKMKSTCFQGENSTTGNIFCNHKNPQKWHLPKGSPNISQFFPRCMGNKSTQTKESNWMSVASHEWFSPMEKKSMKILMKVCSCQTNFLLQVNQSPYPTINIYQFWDTLWDKAPYSSPIWVQTIRIYSRLFVG